MAAAHDAVRVGLEHGALAVGERDDLVARLAREVLLVVQDLDRVDTAAQLGGPIAVRSAAEHQRVPVGFVVQLLECLLCNATSSLKPFLKMPNGVKNLVGTLSHYEELMYDADGPDILDRA